MVEVLVRVVLETKHVMHWVIEVAPDASTPHAGRFRFQIEHLPDHASFPEQARIEPGTVSFQRVLVGRDHPQTEAPIAGDVLETRHLLGGLLDIRVDEGRWCADSARWASSGRHVDHRDRRRVMISM